MTIGSLGRCSEPPPSDIIETRQRSSGVEQRFRKPPVVSSLEFACHWLIEYSWIHIHDGVIIVS